MFPSAEAATFQSIEHSEIYPELVSSSGPRAVKGIQDPVPGEGTDILSSFTRGSGRETPQGESEDDHGTPLYDNDHVENEIPKLPEEMLGEIVGLEMEKVRNSSAGTVCA